MHKNNPTYSFLFEGFNLWKHVLFKQIETDNPSNGALTKSRPSFSMTLYIRMYVCVYVCTVAYPVKYSCFCRYSLQFSLRLVSLFPEVNF